MNAETLAPETPAPLESKTNPVIQPGNDGFDGSVVGVVGTPVGAGVERSGVDAAVTDAVGTGVAVGEGVGVAVGIGVALGAELLLESVSLNSLQCARRSGKRLEQELGRKN